MASKLGPRIVTDNLVLALDCADAKSYAGEPVTNMAYNLSVAGHGSTWEAISEVPSSIGQTGPGANVDFKKLHDNSVANTFSGANGKIFRNYVNNPATSDNTSFNNNGGFRYSSAIGLTSGGDSGYVIISFWCYLVTGYQGYGGNGLSSTYMRFQNSGGYTGNGNRTFYVDGVSKSASETFNADTGRWKFVQIRFSKPTGSTAIQNFYIYADRNTQGEMYICQLQIEDRSDSTFYQVPFVEGASSRSATDGWVDLSGNSNDGTLNNGPVTGTSHYRSGDVILPNSARYLDFDGSDDYVTVSVTGTKTVEVWFNPDTTSGTNVLYCPHTNGYDNWLSFSGASNIVTLVGTESADTNNFSITGGSISAGNWYQAVAIIDGTTATLYVNGSQVATTTKAFTIGSWSGNATIGRRGALSQSYANAQIGLVRVYDKALSAAEVLDNYNSTKSRFS